MYGLDGINGNIDEVVPSPVTSNAEMCLSFLADWCDQKWEWFYAPTSNRNCMPKALAMAIRVIAFLPLLGISFVAYPIQYLGLAITRCIRNMNTKDVDLLTAITAQGTAERVKELLKAGANAKCVNTRGDTALHRAVQCDRVDLIPLLAQAGADIYALDVNNETPFYYAWKGGKVNAIKALIDAGFDTNKPDSNGEYILHKAVTRSGYEMGIEELTDKQTVMLSALLYDRKLCLDTMSNKGETAVTLTPLNQVWVLKMLLENGARSYYPNCAPEIGFQNSQDADLTLLKQLGIDPNKRNKNGLFPLPQHLKIYRKLHYAAKEFEYKDPVINEHCVQCLKIIKALLNKCSDVNKVRVPGDIDLLPPDTILQYVIEKRLHKVLEMIVADKRFDLDERNGNGIAPIEHAATFGDKASFDILLRAGATFDPNQLAPYHAFLTQLIPLEPILPAQTVPLVNSFQEKAGAHRNRYIDALVESCSLTSKPASQTALYYGDPIDMQFGKALKFFRSSAVEEIEIQQHMRQKVVKMVSLTLLPKEIVNIIVEYNHLAYNQKRLPKDTRTVDVMPSGSQAIA